MTIDLARPQNEPQRFDVPAGLVEIRVENRAPGARYGVTLDTGQGRRQMGLPGPLPGEQSVSASSPECEDWILAQKAFLRVTEEKDAAAAYATALRAARTSACRYAEAQSRALAYRVRDKLSSLLGVVPGVPARVIIERLDEARKPVARWEAVVVGPARSPGWRYANEGQWLVATVASDVARLVRYARTGRLPALAVAADDLTGTGELPAYRLQFSGDPSWNPEPFALQVREHVWATEAYEPLAAALLAREHLKPQPFTSADPLLEALTDLRHEVLLQEGQRLSETLAAHPLDPLVHERAALLLGALGLREGSGEHSDARPTLCAMAAHLALAAALRGGGSCSPEGSLAAVIVDLLAERTTPAIARLARLEQTLRERPARPWSRALDLRLNLSWRQVAPDSLGTRLERLCYTQALREAAGEARALDFLDQHPAPPDADLVRLLFSGWPRAYEQGVSVEVANILHPSSVAIELREASALVDTPAGMAPDAVARSLTQLLSQSRARLGGETRPVVASRAFLAAAAERHILDAARAEVAALYGSLGLKQDALKRLDELSMLLQPLPLARFLPLPWRNEDPQLRQPVSAACSALAELLGREPESVSPSGWGEMARVCVEARDEGRLPPFEAWHRPVVPAGTAYGAGARLAVTRVLYDKVSPQEATALHTLSPREPFLLALYTKRKLGRWPTAADIKGAWGPSWENQRRPLLMIAKRATSDEERTERLGARARLCAIDAAECLPYGGELVEAGQAAAAAQAYEKAVAGARDRVAVSNEADWLADYYLDNDRAEAALELATKAGDTYSSRGLSTLGRILERLGRLAEAEAAYRRESQRYESKSLAEFYLRRAHRGDMAFRMQADAALKELFGDSGLLPATLDGLQPMPKSFPSDFGLVLTADWMTPRYIKAGLQENDVVLAVDGVRIHNQEQFYCVRSFTDEPRIRLILQRDGKLIEQAGPFLRTRFGPPATRATGQPGRKAS